MCVHLNLTSNPLLAETFEIPELKFIAEKVSHNPVVLAYHAEGEGWELYATSCGKTKFWGRIMNCQSSERQSTHNTSTYQAKA
jgi:hypothetical protein